MSESTAQHIITANNKDGKAEFHEIKKPLVNERPSSTETFIYGNTVLPADMSFSATTDLEITSTHRQTGLTSGRITLDKGIASAFITMKPGASPMHRTRTLDLMLVFDGEIELHLDNGDVKTLKRGDTIVQRGTMHKWVNKTDQDVIIYGVSLDALPIAGADGKEMPEEWLI